MSAWRLFISDDDNRLHLFNLSKPHSFGMVQYSEVEDTDHINEYKFIEEMWSARLATWDDYFRPYSGPLLENIEDMRYALERHDEIEVHFKDFEDAAEIARGMLQFHSNVAEKRFFEGGGYITIVPANDVSDTHTSKIPQQLTLTLRKNFQDQMNLNRSIATRIELIHDELQFHSLHKLEENSDNPPTERTIGSMDYLNQILRNLQIPIDRTSFSIREAVAVLQQSNIKISQYQIKENWIKKGKISHELSNNQYKISRESLTEIIKNGGPLNANSYKSEYRPNPAKRPKNTVVNMSRMNHIVFGFTYSIFRLHSCDSSGTGVGTAHAVLESGAPSSGRLWFRRPRGTPGSTRTSA